MVLDGGYGPDEFRFASTSGCVYEALALIAQRPFSNLLAELNMPGDGSTAIAVMRRQQPQAAIIVITGFIGPDDISPAVRALADEVLFKPVEIPVLIATVHRLGSLA